VEDQQPDSGDLTDDASAAPVPQGKSARSRHRLPRHKLRQSGEDGTEPVAAAVEAADVETAAAATASAPVVEPVADGVPAAATDEPAVADAQPPSAEVAQAAPKSDASTDPETEAEADAGPKVPETDVAQPAARPASPRRSRFPWRRNKAAAVEPGATELTAPEPVAAGSDPVEPFEVESTAVELTRTSSGDAESAQSEPAATEPASTEPAATQPDSAEPAATEPAATEPAAAAPPEDVTAPDAVDEDIPASDESDPASDEPETILVPHRPAGRGLKVAAVAAGALVVAAAAFAAAAVQPYLAERAAVHIKVEVATTAAEAIQSLWTYTPDDIDKLADRTARYLGGDFAIQYRQFIDGIVEANKQAQVTNSTEVKGAAVESLTATEASALVYTNSVSTSPVTKGIPSLRYLSYRLTLQRSDGRWLITRMQDITSLDLTPRL
jgi:Mce-associated membrane protein